MTARVGSAICPLWLAVAFSGGLAGSGLAAGPAVPGYEVKFFLDPGKVLGTDRKPTKAARDLLGIQSNPSELSMEFLDGKHLDLHSERWDVRFREIDGKPELTYKRRYPVQDDEIAATLDVAARQGFDANQKAFEAEIEWGFERKTLSFSLKEEVAGPGGPIKNAVKKLPENLKKWARDGWAEAILSDAHEYDTVHGKRWTGKRDEVDDKIAFEVWQIRKEGTGGDQESYVEVSFKKKDRSKANESRERLLKLLRGREGWLLEEDQLKTELILKRYK